MLRSRLASAMVMLLFKPSSAVRAGPLLRTSSRMLASPRRSARPVAVATEAAVPVFDERLVSEDPELVKSSLLRRKAGDALLASVDRIGELTGERASVISEGNTARMEKKTLSQKIGGHMKAGEQDEAAALKVEVAKLNEVADASDAKVDELEAQRSSLFNSLPNLLDPRTPEGVDEDSNVEVNKWGCEAELPTGRLWHDDVGTSLGGIDMERAAKLSGARFAVLKGSIARLERALQNLFVDTHVDKHGYTEAAVPYVVGAEALKGTGQLPKFEEDLFELKAPLNGRRGFLIPTAEVPLTNLHSDEILDESQLPISYVANTPCFRAEAGSGGRDTRGLFRQHQFHKVELVKICTPEQSDEAHHQLVADVEAVMQLLELPYRKVLLCSGDIGFSARMCYDIEVWLPGQEKFREISSCSNCGDFQARRMNLRYRPSEVDAKGKQLKPRFCHTLNGSGLAVGRTLVAVLENYQQDDGSVRVPKALQSYMGGLEIILPEA